MFQTDNMVIMGDFNAAMERKMDKFTPGSLVSEIPLRFKYWMKENGLKDNWRIHKPQSRFFSRMFIKVIRESTTSS